MPRPVTITYRVSPTPAAVAQAAAQLFADAIIKAAAARGLARVAISGGTTPKAMFALLADPANPSSHKSHGTSSSSTGSTSAASHPTTPTPTTA